MVLIKRHAYKLINAEKERPILTLIHYIGDHTVAVNFLHSNWKHSTIYVHALLYWRTIKYLPGNVYKKVATMDSDCIAELQVVLKPRNSKQVSQCTSSQSTSLSRCFIHSSRVSSWPQWFHEQDNYLSIIMCGLKSMPIELDRVLQLAIAFIWHISVGDFHLSPLLNRSFVIPAAFLIRSRVCMRNLCIILCHLYTTARVPIVTDDEVVICKAIDKFLPSLTYVRCWNDVINAVKLWLRKHGAIYEIPVYIAQLRDLFYQPTEENYEAKLAKLEPTWSRPFFEYYNSTL